MDIDEARVQSVSRFMTDITYTIKVFLDPDDDDQIQTDNFSSVLETAVEGIMRDGYCLGYEVTIPDGTVKEGWRG